MDDPDALVVLAKHLPELAGMADAPQAGMARGFGLATLRELMPQLLSEEKMAAIAEDLAKL